MSCSGRLSEDVRNNFLCFSGDVTTFSTWFMDSNAHTWRTHNRGHYIIFLMFRFVVFFPAVDTLSCEHVPVSQEIMCSKFNFLSLTPKHLLSNWRAENSSHYIEHSCLMCCGETIIFQYKASLHGVLDIV